MLPTENKELHPITEIESKTKSRTNSRADENVVLHVLDRTIANDMKTIDIEQKEDTGGDQSFVRQTFWKSCCGLMVDKRAIQYFVQVAIGSTVMFFCMMKIWHGGPNHVCTGEDITVYISLLSAIVGFYIPAPTMKS
jgi:hypothetical protein